MSKREPNKLIAFESKTIRRVWHNEEWWFAIIDVVGALTDSSNPADYFKKMRRRDEGLKTYVGTNCPPLEMEGETGKKRKTLAGNLEAIFRIIQSIPSKKAEPFKQWLAQTGSERVEETENPELIIERFRELYRGRGYSDEWKEERIRGIDTRKLLTEEWKQRGIKEGLEYAKLTNEITKGTFGKTVGDYKGHKNLQKAHNLRDHMTEEELIFNRLGELATTRKIEEHDTQGYQENEQAAKEGGQAAGDARRAFEDSVGRSVISDDNYLQQIKEAKKKKKLPSAKE